MEITFEHTVNTNKEDWVGEWNIIPLKVGTDDWLWEDRICDIEVPLEEKPIVELPYIGMSKGQTIYLWVYASGYKVEGEYYNIKTKFTASEYYEKEDNNSEKKATKLVAGKYIKGNISDLLDKDYYEITAPANGRLDIEFKLTGIQFFTEDYCPQISIEMRDNIDGDYNKIKSLIDAGVNVNRQLPYIGVTKGHKYYISVEAFNDRYPLLSAINYEFVTKFTPSDDYEKEGNNSFDNATEIFFGKKLQGINSSYNDPDWYKFTATKNGKVNIVMKNMPSDSKRRIVVNENPDAIHYIYDWTAANDKQTSLTINATKGRTYYIYITSESPEYHGTMEGVFPYTLSVIYGKSVTGIKLDKISATLTPGSQIKLKETITPSDAADQGVLWESSNPSVATISDRVVTAKKAGKAVITAMTVDGNKTAKCTITVKDKTVAPTSVKLNKSSVAIATKKTLQLKATVSPSNATNKNVSWHSSNTNVATVDSNGKVTTHKLGTAVISATSKVNYKLQAKCTISVNRFYDVNDPSKYYYKPVYWAVEKSIARGYNDEYFGPQKNCSRREMTIFLWRLAGRPYASGSISFSDVSYSRTSDTYKAILWASKKGIVKGYTSGKYKGQFRPNDPVSRKDTMIMLYRLAGKPKVSGNIKFSDCKLYLKSSDTYKAILWGTKKGITNGYTSGKDKGKFKPLDNCLREHIVTFIYRYSQKK